MLWFIDAGDLAAASAVRADMMNRVAAHATRGADLDAAGVVIGELITNAVEHGGTDVCAEFEWLGSFPRVVVHDAGPGFELDDLPRVGVERLNGRGLLLARSFARNLRAIRRPGGGMTVTAMLDVARSRTRRPEHERVLPALVTTS